MTTADAMVNAHHPALHEREDAVYALEPEMSGELADDLGGMLAVGDSLVGLVAVGENRRVGSGVSQDERMQ